MTACACIFNVTCHSTVMEYRKTVFKYVHKPLLWQQNTLNYKSFVKKIPIWMHTPPDFIPVTACARTINVTCRNKTLLVNMTLFLQE